MLPMKWTDRIFRFDVPLEMYPNVLERLRGAAPRIDAKLRGLSREALTRRYGEKWSVQEHVAHLLDLDVLHAARLEDYAAGVEVLRPANTANPQVAAQRYNERELREILEPFRREREKFIARLEAWPRDQVGRSALHPRLKVPMRVIDMAYFVAEHDDHHLAAMTELLRRHSA